MNTEARATADRPIFLLQFHRYDDRPSTLFTWIGPFAEQAEVQAEVDRQFDRLIANGFRYDPEALAAVKEWTEDPRPWIDGRRVRVQGPPRRVRFAIQFRTETYEPGDCP